MTSTEAEFLELLQISFDHDQQAQEGKLLETLDKMGITLNQFVEMINTGAEKNMRGVLPDISSTVDTSVSLSHQLDELIRMNQRQKQLSKSTPHQFLPRKRRY